MKPERPKNSIQTHGSKAKPKGADPGLGRISRMRDPDIYLDYLDLSRQATLPQANWRDSIDIRNMPTMIRSLGLLVITLLIIGGSIFLWLRSQMAHSLEQVSVLPQENTKILSKFVSPSEEEALNLVKHALAIRNPEKVADCFRIGVETPEEIVNFLKTTDEKEGRIDNFEWLRSMDTDDLLIEGVLVYYTKNKEHSERLAMLVPDDMGVWKLDFGSYARICKPSWDDLLAGRVSEAEVRIVITPDSYYNGPFLNDSNWVCYAILSPDIKKLLPEDSSLLHGYCKEGTPQARAMERIFLEEAQMSRVIVKIQRVEDGNSTQFEITRVLSRDWVMPSKPFDEKF